jgi:hypothetical protein
MEDMPDLRVVIVFDDGTLTPETFVAKMMGTT